MKHHEEVLEYKPQTTESLDDRLTRIQSRALELCKENYLIQKTIAGKHVCTEQIPTKASRISKEAISRSCFIASGIKRMNEEDRLFYDNLFSTNDLGLQENRSDEYQKNVRRYLSQFKKGHSLTCAEPTEGLRKRNSRAVKREGEISLDGGMYISDRNKKFNKKLIRGYVQMADPSGV
ncbi:hypothetical protein XU18_0068 [Perkinsela sp. CCAP 1560/4]|nr:hypothetical protein XU18_0068 [Perkinsela sp. CCAP 1560/4]|eukprot:KNH09383.1 hypothetical protein XU18_0068 [Perkinsela sp. CCAP 1560/4]